MELRLASRFAKRLQPSRCLLQLYAPSPTRTQWRHASTVQPQQAKPLGGFYEAMLEEPAPTIATVLKEPTPHKEPPANLKRSQKDEITEKANVVFGSRLAGPAERRSEIESQSTMIAGIMVPPRPGEPDNCCMSGCVNCVWDQYRDELEEWAAAKATADKALKKQSSNLAMTMDDDGGGSETNWSTGLETDLSSEDLFKGVPVGIREFMKQEKKLKEMHIRNGTSSG